MARDAAARALALVALAHRRGWSTADAAKGVRCGCPHCGYSVIVHKTPRDPRSVLNDEGRMRRHLRSDHPDQPQWEKA